MKKILILSDMFGQIDENNYMGITTHFFNTMNHAVESYSSLDLGGIKGSMDRDNLHQLFLDNGIKIAARTLSNKSLQYDLGIGFSIGGLILWEACKINPHLLKNLVCISSTRLRYETTNIKPTKTTLIYGENDGNSPNLSVIQKLSDNYLIIPNNNHDFYKHADVLKEVLISLKVNCILHS